MSEHAEFDRLTEEEAAILLYAATVVADGQVHSDETKELVQQVKLIMGDCVNSEAKLEKLLADFLSYFRVPLKANPLLLSPAQVAAVADRVVREDLRLLVMNAVFEISFADDDYHEREREIVKILRDKWSV